MIIFHLQYRIIHTGSGSNYFFSELPKIVEFLNHREQRWGLRWQTVAVIELDSNERQPFIIPGYEHPCNAFRIDLAGNMKPLNVHSTLAASDSTQRSDASPL